MRGCVVLDILYDPYSADCDDVDPAEPWPEPQGLTRLSSTRLKSTEDKHGSIPTQLADCRAAVQGREIVDEIATLVGLSRSRVYELLQEAGER